MEQACIKNNTMAVMEAVVIRSLARGCTEARVRDFGTVFIPKAVSHIGDRPRFGILPGDWLLVEFPVMSVKNPTLLNDPSLQPSWTATKIFGIPSKLPVSVIQERESPLSVKIWEVPAVVVDKERFPRVYSEALGLIKLRMNTTKGFDPEKFQVKEFVHVSVAPLIMQCNLRSGQASWIAEDIRKDKERKLKDGDFPSLKVRRTKEFSLLCSLQGYGFITVS